MQQVEQIKNKFHRLRAERTVAALTKNGLKARYVEKNKDAVKAVLELIPPDAIVGCTGSFSIRQLGLVEMLEKRGNKVVHHWLPGLSPEEDLRLRHEELGADVLLTSCNAITMDGKIIDIDAAGNRAAGTMFGPGKVIVVVGVNKIAFDEEEGLHRARHIAAPLNAIRYSLDTPCAKTGFCSDCRSPQRICKVVLIIERKPSLTDLEVILVGEELGF